MGMEKKGHSAGAMTPEALQERQARLKAKQAEAKDAQLKEAVRAAAPSPAEARKQKLRDERGLPGYVRAMDGTTESPQAILHVVTSALSDTDSTLRGASEAVQNRVAEKMTEHGNLVFKLNQVSSQLEEMRALAPQLTVEDGAKREEVEMAIERLENARRLILERFDALRGDAQFSDTLRAEAETELAQRTTQEKMRTLRLEFGRISDELCANVQKELNMLSSRGDAGPFEHFDPAQKADRYMQWIAPSLLHLKTLESVWNSLGEATRGMGELSVRDEIGKLRGVVEFATSFIRRDDRSRYPNQDAWEDYRAQVVAYGDALASKLSDRQYR